MAKKGLAQHCEADHFDYHSETLLRNASRLDPVARAILNARVSEKLSFRKIGILHGQISAFKARRLYREAGRNLCKYLAWETCAGKLPKPQTPNPKPQTPLSLKAEE